MKNLYIKQKVLSLSEKFVVTDEYQDPCYYVEGSFFQIPKTFSVYDQLDQQVGEITKKVFSFLPKFFVNINGYDEIILEKEFTFFKPQYHVVSEDIRVEGDFWGMDFSVYHQDEEIAHISKKWFTWGDTYEVSILDESLETLIVCLVVAIDCVKADEQSSKSSSQ